MAWCLDGTTETGKVPDQGEQAWAAPARCRCAGAALGRAGLCPARQPVVAGSGLSSTALLWLKVSIEYSPW